MMDYRELYYALIDNARSRELCDGEYYESHHIIPKCMGGTDDSENLVRLTAYEHYTAHKYLAMWMPDEAGLQYAWWMMCHKTINGRSYTVSAEDYEEIKVRRSKLLSEWSSNRVGELNSMFGKKWSDETRSKILSARTGVKRGKYNMSEEGSRSIANSVRERNTGKKLNYKPVGCVGPRTEAQMDGARKSPSPDAKMKMSVAKKGIPLSKDHTSNISKAWKNVKVLTCPHCGKEGKNNMKRYHFDNCKHRGLEDGI